MIVNDFVFAAVAYKEDGTPVGQLRLDADWEPAAESARFAGLRAGRLLPLGDGDAHVEPLWHAELGEPYLSGFRVRVGDGDSGEAVGTFRNAYFQTLVEQLSTGLVEEGKLKKGELFRYHVCAYPRPGERAARPAARFAVKSVPTPPPLRDASLKEFRESAASVGEHEAADFPVFLRGRILAETAVLTRHAGNRETGGVLIGHLNRDAAEREIFLDITAQIPARHTDAASGKLTFTAKTWKAADDAIRLRRNGETLVGWWHSHPVREWCKECPPEKKAKCSLKCAFFSADDRSLHRTVFHRAWHVGLLVTDTDDGLEHALFGWRDGLVSRRGFHVQFDDEEPS